MKIHKDIDSIRSISKPILTIGTFDGVHLGHRVIIDRLNEIAAEVEGESVLLTFHPHPRSVVAEATGIELLSTIEERLHLLDQAGLQHIIIHPFTHEFSRISALEYVRGLLVNQIGVHTTVVGYDHHFGRNREGDIKLLRELAEVYDFNVEEISPQMIEEVNVSSTKIRRALKNGEVDTVRTYLGYDYSISGTVVHGDGRGKTIGFPTANILVDDPDKLVPGEGVYAVTVLLEAKEYMGMLNIGTRPTFKESTDPEVTLEVHLIDQDVQLYGKQLTIMLKHRLREEEKFASADALHNQLVKDKQRSIELLRD